jgi:hypothetical protein
LSFCLRPFSLQKRFDLFPGRPVWNRPAAQPGIDALLGHPQSGGESGLPPARFTCPSPLLIEYTLDSFCWHCPIVYRNGQSASTIMLLFSVNLVSKPRIYRSGAVSARLEEDPNVQSPSISHTKSREPTQISALRFFCTQNADSVSIREMQLAMPTTQRPIFGPGKCLRRRKKYEDKTQRLFTVSWRAEN